MAGAPEFIGRIPVRVSACIHVLTTAPDPSPHISPQVRHGLEPEFIGRIPVRVACQRLREADLFRVLTDAHDSVAAQIVRDFEGCELSRTRQIGSPSDRAIGLRLIAIVIPLDCHRDSA